MSSEVDPHIRFLEAPRVQRVATLELKAERYQRGWRVFEVSPLDASEVCQQGEGAEVAVGDFGAFDEVRFDVVVVVDYLLVDKVGVGFEGAVARGVGCRRGGWGRHWNDLMLSQVNVLFEYLL